MGKIFINYRRDDARSAAEFLHHILVQNFGTDRVLMDVETIPPGADFEETLKAYVAECDVFLALIGRQWLTLQDSVTGGRRIDNPKDWVRFEIEAAIDRDITVIPVLIEGADMPRPGDMPAPPSGEPDRLAAFIRRQAWRLQPGSFPADANRLSRHVSNALEQANADRAAEEAARERAAEEARRRAEADRRREQEEAQVRARAEGLAHLSEDQIARAEEMARWEFIKDAPSVADLRDHLARFPNGVLSDQVAKRLEERVWARTDKAVRSDLEAYLEEFPEGVHAQEAKTTLGELVAKEREAVEAQTRAREEAIAWEAVKDSRDPKTLDSFLRDWPEGAHADEARRLRRAVRARPAMVWGGVAVALVAVGVAAWFVAGRSALRVFVARTLPEAPVTRDWSGVAERAAAKDCETCPAMIVLPAGSFTMGSPESERGRDRDEGPQREVSVPRFAIGRTEVTFAQWDACVGDGFCRAVSDDAGWGRGSQPVIHVSWQDITGVGVDERGFLAWMNAKVDGAPYRLPTEAEWEYAARAGTTTRFSWGDTDPICASQASNGANFRGDGCPGRALPVGVFEPNPWGLYDVHGNVWEWVQDCWNDSYEGAPTDGSAWTAGDCQRAVVRGGGWGSNPRNLRAANRGNRNRGFRNGHIGFRVARTLPR